MSTAALIAATPSRIWVISRSSGPRTAATMQNSLAPVARGLLGRLDQLGDVEPHRAHRRGELAGLAAEVAVLGAAAGLERDDALDLDLGAAPLHPHLVGQREQLVEHARPGCCSTARICSSVERLTALEHLLAGGREPRTGRSGRGLGVAVVGRHGPIMSYAAAAVDRASWSTALPLRATWPRRCRSCAGRRSR